MAHKRPAVDGDEPDVAGVVAAATRSRIAQKYARLDEAQTSPRARARYDGGGAQGRPLTGGAHVDDGGEVGGDDDVLRVTSDRGVSTSSGGQREEHGIGVGLNIRIHPALQKQQQQRPTPDLAPDGSAVAAGKSNPYFDPSTAGRGERRHRGLQFNLPGKYVQAADERRDAVQLKELRSRVEERARKVGIESELARSARALQTPRPPEIEWWDGPIVGATRYPATEECLRCAVHDAASPVTAQIQHPVAIPVRAEGRAELVTTVKYTKQEQKKLRRQDRQAKLRDKQDKQRLGLIAPDAPKVKLSNMMSVVGNAAIRDPTKVEQEIVAQVKARREMHDQDNAMRKLTAAEKQDKASAALEADAAKGIRAAAWRVDTLANGYHRRRVEQNAEQCGLTGIVILHPQINLIYVEGGLKAIKFFKRLVEQRIHWTEGPQTRRMHTQGAPSNGQAGNDRAGNDRAGNDRAGDDRAGDGADDKLDTVDAVGARPDYAANRCTIVWEGDLPERRFGRLIFKKCASEAQVREALRAGPAYGIWQAAKRAGEQDL